MRTGRIRFKILCEQRFHCRLDPLQVREPLTVLFLRRAEQPAVFLWLQKREREILQLAAQVIHAEAIGERTVNFVGFQSHALLLRGRQRGERRHIMESVGELDKNDAQILAQGQNHLAHILRLVFRAAILDAAELRHAVHEESNLVAEFAPHIIE